MQIYSVQQGQNLLQSLKSVPRIESTQEQQPAAKKDTAFISEEAKDLEALMNGKTVEEEQQESQTAKDSEAAADCPATAANEAAAARDAATSGLFQ